MQCKEVLVVPLDGSISSFDSIRNVFPENKGQVVYIHRKIPIITLLE